MTTDVATTMSDKKGRGSDGVEQELSKTEQRRLAKKRKKERLSQERRQKSRNEAQKGKKAKITKEERREKYTQRARERRETKRRLGREQDMVCYHCRKKGHSALRCPERSADVGEGVAADATMCYRCGSTEHRLSACPKLRRERRKGRDGNDGNTESTELPFATCFVCGQRGHLASQCESNPKGVFVSGAGSCRRCGRKDHLAKDCPLKVEEEEKSVDDDDDVATSQPAPWCRPVPTDGVGGDDDPGLTHEDNKVDATSSKKPRKAKVVQF